MNSRDKKRDRVGGLEVMDVLVVVLFKINLRVFCVTSNNLATKYRLLGGPLAKNNEPRSACVSRPTLTRIL